MISHLNLGKYQEERRKNLAALIRKSQISFAGYRKGKIYGLLSCSSGKRMKIENRVFFKNESEALVNSYRPCGNCLPQKYKLWKEANMAIGNSKE